jgi:thioesterase domain-containing protein
MSTGHSTVFLSGAGGGVPDLDVFREGPDDPTRVEAIGYPGWKRYAAEGYSADALIDDLATEIGRRVPSGAIRIIGVSIGGHFGYAVGLRLRAQGRDIAGLCAIDSMMMDSSGPSAGWRQRALGQAFELLRGRRLRDFVLFMRSKFWRALVRAPGDRLWSLVRRCSAALPWVSAVDPLFEEELSMRLLLRIVAPWMASLDRNPVALEAPAILLRTGFAAGDDDAWRRRCPDIRIFEISGAHHNLFDAENAGTLHDIFIDATRSWRESIQSAVTPSILPRLLTLSKDAVAMTPADEDVHRPHP